MIDTTTARPRFVELDRMQEAPVPTCDVCDAPVKAFTRHVSYRDGAILMTAYCHGDRQDVRLPFVGGRPPRLVALGRAFVSLKLEAAP